MTALNQEKFNALQTDSHLSASFKSIFLSAILVKFYTIHNHAGLVTTNESLYDVDYLTQHG